MLACGAEVCRSLVTNTLFAAAAPTSGDHQHPRAQAARSQPPFAGQVWAAGMDLAAPSAAPHAYSARCDSARGGGLHVGHVTRTGCIIFHNVWPLADVAGGCDQTLFLPLPATAASAPGPPPEPKTSFGKRPSRVMFNLTARHSG